MGREAAITSPMLERVREPQLDERLTRDTDAFRFLVDRAQQIRGKVDVHALHSSAVIHFASSFDVSCLLVLAPVGPR